MLLRNYKNHSTEILDAFSLLLNSNESALKMTKFKSQIEVLS